jgi:CRP-like cAMP-binding protein
MECSTLVDVARGQPLFEGLSAEHMDKLAGMASLVRFAPDEIIFREGDKSHYFYLVQSGRVALEVNAPGRVLTVETLTVGDELGLTSFLEEGTRPMQARALDPVEALRFDGELLRKVCLEDRELGYALEHRLLKVFSDRLQATLLQLLDMYGSDQDRHKGVQSKISS